MCRRDVWLCFCSDLMDPDGKMIDVGGIRVHYKVRAHAAAPF